MVKNLENPEWGGWVLVASSTCNGIFKKRVHRSEEIQSMKFIFRCLPVLALSFVPLTAHAQAEIEAYLGLGSAWDKAAGGGIDNNTGASCTVVSTSPSCQATPALSGVFMDLGGGIMFTQKFGFGANIAFQPAKGDYGPLQYRQSFIDVDGIYEPIGGKRWGLQIFGGIGSAKSSFSYTATSCVGTAVCTSQSQALGATNHFQTHVGAGLQVFVTQHIFVRPQFDVHYVTNFTDQFGRSSVPTMKVTFGYSSGRL
jgi:hypothetical protein